MPTVVTHAAAAVFFGAGCAGRKASGRFWGCTVVCSVLPDFDVIGFGFGIRYGDLLGHRGFSHSLCLALLSGIFFAAICGCRLRPARLSCGVPPPRGRLLSRRTLGLVAFFTAISILHGLLDAMTDGGLGVAFLSPFSNERFFLPWRPVAVAPISITSLFTRWGLAVFVSEIVWVWGPVLTISFMAALVRRWITGYLTVKKLTV
jgi:inner membrane protein